MFTHATGRWIDFINEKNTMKILVFLTLPLLLACQAAPIQDNLPTVMIDKENRQQTIRQQQEIQYLATRLHKLEERQTALTQSVRALAAGATSESSSDLQKNHFHQAALHYARGDYVRTIQWLNETLAGEIKDEVRENALWLLAQSHYQLAHHESALMAARQLQEKYPKSSHMPDAMLLMAQCRMEKQQKDMARKVLRQIIRRYPQHKAAEQARNLLK